MTVDPEHERPWRLGVSLAGCSTVQECTLRTRQIEASRRAKSVVSTLTIRSVISPAAESSQPNPTFWGRLSMKARPPRKNAMAAAIIAMRTTRPRNLAPTPAKKRTEAMMTATSTKLSPV